MDTLTRKPFVFLRHGQSTHNQLQRIAGHLDVQLTDQGRQEAHHAAQLLNQKAWPLVISSPLIRALETAQIASGRDPDHQDARLAERHWGELEDNPVPRALHYRMTPPGGEPWEDFVTRTIAGLNDALTHDALPLIVGHSGLIRVIRHLSNGEPSGPRTPNARPLLIQPVNQHQWDISLWHPNT